MGWSHPSRCFGKVENIMTIIYAYQSKSKYGNRKSVYGGELYDSRLEVKYATQLDLRKKAKDIREWRRQVSIDLAANGEKICAYKCDFEITHNDGSIELVECKGHETDVWKLKKKLLYATYLKEHPGVRFSIIKQGDI